MHRGITKCPSLLVPKGSRSSKVKIIQSILVQQLTYLAQRLVALRVFSNSNSQYIRAVQICVLRILVTRQFGREKYKIHAITMKIKLAINILQRPLIYQYSLIGNLTFYYLVIVQSMLLIQLKHCLNGKELLQERLFSLYLEKTLILIINDQSLHLIIFLRILIMMLMKVT